MVLKIVLIGYGDSARHSFIRYQEMVRAVGGIGAEDEGAAMNKHDHLQSG